MTNKLASRKFWVCVAAFLASIAGSVAGFATTNEVVAGIGLVCAVLSGAIYAACEAYVDGSSVKSTSVSVTATSNAKDVVTSILKTDGKSDAGE